VSGSEPAAFQPVKSADRTVDVLEALAASPDRLTLGELARQLGFPKSSLHGVLRTLLARGWVRTDVTGTRFGLGLRALLVGASYVDPDDSVAVLAPVLDDLSEHFGETVHLGRLDGLDIVYLAKRESVHPLRLFSAIGRRLPAHATALGKVLLAQRTDAELTRLLPTSLRRLTAHTLVTRTALLRDLRATRDRGYAVDHEENSEGIVCLAVAVPARAGTAAGAHPVDAISISVPTARLDPVRQQEIVAALLTALG
jgi:DNA-binding IclR family transcriptional regulator